MIFLPILLLLVLMNWIPNWPLPFLFLAFMSLATLE